MLCQSRESLGLHAATAYWVSSSTALLYCSLLIDPSSCTGSAPDVARDPSLRRHTPPQYQGHTPNSVFPKRFDVTLRGSGGYLAQKARAACTLTNLAASTET
eukprot:2248630-Rhodomonas_salina.5